ncbi:MAG: hypothetical protein WD810_09975 [Solirubrobacterales bacterium]
MDPDRARAGGLEQRHRGALGGQLTQGVAVADRPHRGSTRRVLRSHLQRERALAGGGDHPLGGDREPDLPLAPEPPQAGGGEDDRVEVSLGELAQAGVDVAVQLLDPQVRARRQQLGAAAQARGADPGPLGHVLERPAGPDPDVGRVLARRHRGDLQALRHLSRQVLGGVDAEVGLTGQQRPLDPVHEARLVPGLAVGGHLDQLRPANQLGHLARLGQSKLAAASGNSNHADLSR